MRSHDDLLSTFHQVVLEAGRIQSADDLIQFVKRSSDAIEGGMAATVEEMSTGNVRNVDEIFTRLDSAKALVAKNLIHRRDVERAGHEQPDFLLSVPNPGTVSSYLKTRRLDTAIVTFHVLGRDRVAIFLARGGGGKAAESHGIPGFGDVHYDFVYLNGVKAEFLDAVDLYAASITQGAPDFQLVRSEFEFLATIVFMLLFKPRPPQEVIFIPHKLYAVLPLHALSVDMEGQRLYLHDVVQTISYASCLQELVYAGTAFRNPGSQDAGTRRYLRVRDDAASLHWLAFEEKNQAAFREQFRRMGVAYDVVTRSSDLPTDFSDYVWVSWSSHAQTSADTWAGSFLELDRTRVNARTIALDWNFRRHPTVVLAGCETAVDTTAGFTLDESFGVDLAFRAAGARAVVASLWPVEDPIAAMTSVIIPAWWFQFGLTPDASLTALQRHLRTRTWKQLLLRDEQLRALPPDVREQVSEAQEDLWNLPDDAFEREDSWACFRCHGR